MKSLLSVLLLFGSLAFAQQLTPNGMKNITANTELSQKKNFEKILTYMQDYVVNDRIQISNVVPNELIQIKGKEDNVACYVNRKMGSKTCFTLDYTMNVIAKDKAFVIEVTDLNAANDAHPNKNYNSWFEESGEPYSMLQSCVTATSEYFLAFKEDFIDYIETGDYW